MKYISKFFTILGIIFAVLFINASIYEMIGDLYISVIAVALIVTPIIIIPYIGYKIYNKLKHNEEVKDT